MADRTTKTAGKSRPALSGAPAGAKLPDSDWTILVQSVNHHLPHIADILWRFDFLPYARLDDLMISYAARAARWGRI